MSGYGQRLIQLWNDWQLSAAVLLSLSLQLLLLSTAGLRRRTPPSWCSKSYFWALYIGSRFIAPYALGILSRASKGDADADIQAFWAALLLFHLGGVDDFTALSLEDNKLWVRRGFETAIHVLTTGYVFFRYFLDPAFRRFIVPFALVYLAGLVKYVEQVVALKRATMEALIESVLGTPDAGPDYDDFMDRVNGILRSGVLPSLNTGNEGVDRPNSDLHNADAPVTTVADRRQLQTPEQAMEIVASARFLYGMFKVLFADGIFSFKERRDGQAKFSDPDASWRAFKVVEIELSFVYDRLYTKASMSRNRVGLIIRVASLLLTLAGSLYTLFTTWHASQYKLRHRCVTYTLLAGAVLADITILVARVFNIRSPLLGSKWLKCAALRLVNRRRWSGYMAQSNLITFCLQNLPSESELVAFIHRVTNIYRGTRGGRTPDLGPLGMQAAVVSPLLNLIVQEIQEADVLQRYFERRSLIDQIRSRSFWKYYKKTKHVPVREELKDFIFKQLKKKESQFNAWERERRGKARSGTSDSRAEAGGTSGENRNPVTARGDQVLKERGIAGLEWSLQEKEFDESLLIWHIATDLCFRQEDSNNQEGNPETMETRNHSHMEMARELSNYMLYIMVVHPLMLSSSTTMATKRCRDTCAEARRHFLKKHVVAMARSSVARDSRRKEDAKDGNEAVGEKNAHASLLEVVEVTPLQASAVKGDKSKSVLWDGCFLAKELTQIMGDPKEKWEVISEVWVEMLCYAAVHCGGYQHAERLKEGGELITFVCLLMTHLGMGKHYRTEVGDAYPHVSPYTA
ncbi:uncharacterized protein LOC133926022 [Phragmites australis]|uniref:uncharacterized protein LOC133926022 n=1 Tax=Phragmites australis TaxID=29695 RepID=UPI002D777786|nr:uncharacterized protein LOC133926022 [Phragmites australis]